MHTEISPLLIFSHAPPLLASVLLVRDLYVPLGCTVSKIFYFLHHALSPLHMDAAYWPNLDPVGSFSFSSDDTAWLM